MPLTRLDYDTRTTQPTLGCLSKYWPISLFYLSGDPSISWSVARESMNCALITKYICFAFEFSRNYLKTLDPSCPVDREVISLSDRPQTFVEPPEMCVLFPQMDNPNKYQFKSPGQSGYLRQNFTFNGDLLILIDMIVSVQGPAFMHRHVVRVKYEILAHS